MKERVCRDGDEGLYQPRIHSDRIKDLFRIGQEAGNIINRLTKQFIDEFCDPKSGEINWERLVEVTCGNYDLHRHGYTFD